MAFSPSVVLIDHRDLAVAQVIHDVGLPLVELVHAAALCTPVRAERLRGAVGGDDGEAELDQVAAPPRRRPACPRRAR